MLKVFFSGKQKAREGGGGGGSHYFFDEHDTCVAMVIARDTYVEDAPFLFFIHFLHCMRLVVDVLVKSLLTRRTCLHFVFDLFLFFLRKNPSHSGSRSHPSAHSPPSLTFFFLIMRTLSALAIWKWGGQSGTCSGAITHVWNGSFL